MNGGLSERESFDLLNVSNQDPLSLFNTLSFAQAVWYFSETDGWTNKAILGAILVVSPRGPCETPFQEHHCSVFTKSNRSWFWSAKIILGIWTGFTWLWKSLEAAKAWKVLPPCCCKLSHPCLPNRVPETGLVLRPFLFFHPDLAEGLGSAYIAVKNIGIKTINENLGGIPAMSIITRDSISSGNAAA